MPLDDAFQNAVNDTRLRAEELFSERGNLTYVIGKLVLPTHLLADGHDHETNTPFDFEGMLKRSIYRRVTGMSQEAISYAKRHRFEDLDTRHFLRAVADELAELAEEHDSTYSPDQPPDADPSPEEVAASGEPIHHYVDRHAKHVITGARNEVWPVLDTGRADNIKHDDSRVWEHQTAMSLSKRAGTHGAFRTFDKFRRDALHHDTHLYVVQKLGLPDDHDYDLSEYSGARLPSPDWREVATSVTNQFNAAIDRQMASIAPTALFTEPVVAAIDTTHDPFNVSPWKDEEEIEPEDDRIGVDGDTGRTKVLKADYPEMVNCGEDKHTYQEERDRRRRERRRPLRHPLWCQPRVEGDRRTCRLRIW